MTLVGSTTGHEAPDSQKNKYHISSTSSSAAEAEPRQSSMPEEEDPQQPAPGAQAADDQEASDLALALLMQEQERAHFLLATGGYGQWGEDAGAAVVEEEEEGADQPAYDPEDTSDEALAWRLMQEEQQQFNARLMNMARAQFAGHDEDEDYDDADGEDGSEGDDPLENAPDIENMTYENLLALQEMAGHVSRGATESALRAIRTSTYTEKEANASEEESEQCTVCRMEFEKGEEISVLPCNHFYHPDCISQWMKVNKACPICNTDVEDK